MTVIPILTIYIFHCEAVAIRVYAATSTYGRDSKSIVSSVSPSILVLAWFTIGKDFDKYQKKIDLQYDIDEVFGSSK